MLANWFKQVFADTDPTADANKTALAAIGLATEVIQADQRCAPEELAQLRSIALDTFAVDANQVDELIAKALEDQKKLVSIQPLTRLINETFSAQQKMELVEAMWKIAYADGNLEKYEEGAIRKIADLLYVSHSVFIQTKLRAAESKLRKGN